MIPAPSGNYTFIKTIGQGSMGKVKLAKKEGTNELVRLHARTRRVSRLFWWVKSCPTIADYV